jgi:hypothetical protein
MQKIDELHSDVSGLDLNFRPETYWGIPESKLANIKGDRRRQRKSYQWAGRFLGLP